MTSFAQFLLVVVIVTLTFLATIVSIQVVHLLHDLRKVVLKFSRILDHTDAISNASAKPLIAVNEFFSEVKGLVNHTQDEMISSTPDRPAKKHLFRRSGLPLRPS